MEEPMHSETRGTSATLDKDVLLSGGAGRSVNSARAGYLPVSLDRVPVGALAEIGVYVRGKNIEKLVAQEVVQGQFALYCAPNIRFSEVHRRRLVEHGVKFIYVRMADQSRFRQQTEAMLESIAGDPAIA